MHIEIHTPELEQRVRRQIQSGRYHDADELLIKALDALEATTPSHDHAAVPQEKRTGAALIAALQASPHRELDIEPPRYREPISVRDIDL